MYGEMVKETWHIEPPPVTAKRAPSLGPNEHAGKTQGRVGSNHKLESKTRKGEDVKGKR